MATVTDVEREGYIPYPKPEGVKVPEKVKEPVPEPVYRPAPVPIPA